MKSLIAVVFSLAICGSVSAQVATDPKFDGAMDLVSVNSVTAGACAAANVTAGQVFVASYRPRMTQGQPASGNSALSWRTLLNYQIIRTNTAASKLYGAGTYTGSKIHGNVDFVSGYTGNYNFTITPAQASLSASTEFVTIKGTITNFQGFAGCTATIRAALSRRP